MNIDHSRTAFLRLDVVLILCVLGLMVLGIAFIYSSGVTSEGIQVSDEWIRQIIWSVSGCILMAVFSLVDYRRWKRMAVPLYTAIVILLVLVLMVGNYIKGARAWLGVGGIGVQPSEFGKLGVIIALAWWFDAEQRGGSDARRFLGALIITAIPMLLVLMQPDLGTAIVYVPIFFTIVFFAGVGWRILAFPLLAGSIAAAGVLGYAWSEHIAAGPAAFVRLFTEKSIMTGILCAMAFLTGLGLLGWAVFRRRSFLAMLYVFGILTTAYIGIAGAARALRGYQMMRLVVFLDPQIDPRGAGWHIIQSVTAVGSGGLRGKGFLEGTQSHDRYLPEQSTDFIFSIIAEEIGFLGGVLIFALFAIIIIRSLSIAYASRDLFGMLIAVGVGAMVSFHVIQNIGMAIGVMPITGIPLFFLSYGGSSLWTALMSVGLLLSIHYRR